MSFRTKEVDAPIRLRGPSEHPGGPHQRQDHEGDRTQTQLCSSASRSFEAMQWISDCIFCFWSPPSAMWEEETHALGAVKGGARVSVTCLSAENTCSLIRLRASPLPSRLYPQSVGSRCRQGATFCHSRHGKAQGANPGAACGETLLRAGGPSPSFSFARETRVFGVVIVSWHSPLRGARI